MSRLDELSLDMQEIVEEYDLGLLSLEEAFLRIMSEVVCSNCPDEGLTCRPTCVKKEIVLEMLFLPYSTETDPS